MNIDIRKAFDFPFKEGIFSAKLLKGGLFYVIPSIFLMIFFILLFYFIVTYSAKDSSSYSLLTFIFVIIAIFITSVSFIIVNCFPAGYVIQSMHNEINNKEDILPEWKSNYLKYFKYGLLISTATFIYQIVLLIISIIMAIIVYMIIASLIKSHSPYLDPFLLSYVFAFFIYTLFNLSFPLIAANYAESLKFTDAFNWGKMRSHFTKAIPEYLTSLAIAIILYTILNLLLNILVCTCIGIIAVPFLYFPAILIIANLFAQTYKKSLDKIERSEV